MMVSLSLGIWILASYIGWTGSQFKHVPIGTTYCIQVSILVCFVDLILFLIRLYFISQFSETWTSFQENLVSWLLIWVISTLGSGSHILIKFFISRFTVSIDLFQTVLLHLVILLCSESAISLGGIGSWLISYTLVFSNPAVLFTTGDWWPILDMRHWIYILLLGRSGSLLSLVILMHSFGRSAFIRILGWGCY